MCFELIWGCRWIVLGEEMGVTDLVTAEPGGEDAGAHERGLHYTPVSAFGVLGVFPP